MKGLVEDLKIANDNLYSANKMLEKEIERLKEDNKYLNKVNIELSTEKNRLNNIINKALEKSKGLQYKFGYVLDDLVYLLMQGSDKE